MSTMILLFATALALGCSGKDGGGADTSLAGCDTATGVGCDCDWGSETCESSDYLHYACDACGNTWLCSTWPDDPPGATWGPVDWSCYCVDDDGGLIDHPDCQVEE